MPIDIVRIAAADGESKPDVCAIAVYFEGGDICLSSASLGASDNTNSLVFQQLKNAEEPRELHPDDDVELEPNALAVALKFGSIASIDDVIKWMNALRLEMLKEESCR